MNEISADSIRVLKSIRSDSADESRAIKAGIEALERLESKDKELEHNANEIYELQSRAFNLQTQVKQHSGNSESLKTLVRDIRGVLLRTESQEFDPLLKRIQNALAE